jgi:hypothetical protein
MIHALLALSGGNSGNGAGGWHRDTTTAATTPRTRKAAMKSRAAMAVITGAAASSSSSSLASPATALTPSTLTVTQRNVFRAFIDCHLTCPYPNAFDVVDLVRDSGATNQQITDWFTNWRKRTYRPLMSGAKKPKDELDRRLIEAAQAGTALTHRHGQLVNFDNQPTPKGYSPKYHRAHYQGDTLGATESWDGKGPPPPRPGGGGRDGKEEGGKEERREDQKMAL